MKFHNWWNAPKTFAKVQEIDPVASHASWMENFPWTRLPGVVPARRSRSRWSTSTACGCWRPTACARYLGDGNFGGSTSGRTPTCWRSGRSAVAETRALLEGPVVVSERRTRSSSGARAPSAARSARPSSAPARRWSSSTRRPTTSPPSTRHGLDHHRARWRRGAVAGAGPSRPTRCRGRSGAASCAVKAHHTARGHRGAGAACGGGRLRRLGPERAQRDT